MSVAAGFSRHSPSGRRVLAGFCLLAMLVVVLAALQARDSARRAWIDSWVTQAQSLGEFADSALAARADLLLVERLTHLARRDEVAYALILDSDGRARFHGNAADVGRKYDSEYTRRALAAKELTVQRIPSHGVLEVDVPLDRGVLRIGFTFEPLRVFHRWLWGGVAFSCAILALLGLAVFRPD